MGPARGRGRGRGNRMPPPPPLMARNNMMPPLRSPPLMPPRMRPPPPPGMRGPPFAPPHPPHPPRLPPPPGFRGIPPRLPPGPLPPPLSPRRFPPRPMFPGPHGPPLLPPPPPPGHPMMDGPHARLRRPPGPPLPFMSFGPMNPMMKKKWNAKKQIISQPAVKKLRKAKNPWITEDILILIEQRKKAYNSKTAEGRKKFLALKNEVTKRSRKAKELWMEQQKVKEGGEKKTEEGENVTANGSSTEKTDNETGAAVKEEGKDGDVTEASTDGTDISNVEPIVKDNCYCVTCERGFKTEEEFATHCAGHVTCGVDGCQLSADPKVIDKHYNMQHKTGLFNRLALEPADVQKWIEERKRRFPTKKNVQENKERLEEMEKRGERLHKENGRFGKRKGGNQTDDQPAKIRKVEPNKPKQKRMKNVLKDESEREFSWRGDLPHFAGTALYPQAEDEMNEDEEEDPSNAQNKMENNDFTDEEWEGDTSLDQINTANKAALPNALLSISGYESASESEAETDVSVTKPIEPVIKPKEAVEPVITVTERVLPVTKSAGSVTKPMEAVAKSVESVPNHVVSVTEPVAQSVVSVTKSVESDTEHVKAVTETDDQSENCEIVKFNFTIETNDDDDDDDEPPEEVKIRKTPDPSFAEKVTEKVEVTAVLNGVDNGAVLTNGNSEHKEVMSNGKLEYSDDKPEENSKQVKNPRKPEMKPVTRTTTISRRRATLLEKLLEPDIRHERNVILQCVRYAVENNFFEKHMKN